MLEILESDKTEEDLQQQLNFYPLRFRKSDVGSYDDCYKNCEATYSWYNLIGRSSCKKTCDDAYPEAYRNKCLKEIESQARQYWHQREAQNQINKYKKFPSGF